MIITGNETKKELATFCCDATKVNAIKVDSQCFKAILNNECSSNSLCLQYLEIPICSAFNYSKKIPANTVLTIDNTNLPYKFIGVYVKDNKHCFWRSLDELADNYETVNYNYTLQFVSEDVTIGSKTPVSIAITLEPDTTVNLMTWANAATLKFDDHYWVRWRDAGLSWFLASPANLSNSLILPSLEGTLTGNLYLNEAQTILSGTVIGDVVSADKKIKFHIEFSVSYNVLTQEVTLVDEFMTAGLNSEFIQEAVNVFPDTPEIDVTDDIITIDVTGKLRTVFAKRWKSLNTILMLSSVKDMAIDKLEIFNNNNTSIEVCILGAF